MSPEDGQMMLELCRRIDRETDPAALSICIADLLKILQRKIDEVRSEGKPTQPFPE